MGKINIGDLKRREYHDKDCVRFEYELPIADATEVEKLVFVFERESNSASFWKVQVVYPKTYFVNAQVYEFEIQMPSIMYAQNIVSVCEMCLNAFQNTLKIEIQDKSIVDFAIGDLIGGFKDAE